jgi:hypothetical protein
MNRLAVDMLCFLLLLFKKGPWNAWFLEDEGRIISSKAREIILVYQYTKKTSFISRTGYTMCSGQCKTQMQRLLLKN